MEPRGLAVALFLLNVRCGALENSPINSAGVRELQIRDAAGQQFLLEIFVDATATWWRNTQYDRWMLVDKPSETAEKWCNLRAFKPLAPCIAAVVPALSPVRSLPHAMPAYTAPPAASEIEAAEEKAIRRLRAEGVTHLRPKASYTAQS